MIFTKESIELIRSGKKTETRRIWKVPHVKVGGLYGVRSSRREKERGDMMIRVTGIRQEFLGDVNSNCNAEGFHSLEEFQQVWKSLHGEWNPRQRVYVIRFEVMPGGVAHEAQGRCTDAAGKASSNLAPGPKVEMLFDRSGTHVKTVQRFNNPDVNTVE